MAEAIIAGIKKASLNANISVGEPVAARRDELYANYGVKVHESNAPAIEGSNLIIFAIKPQQLDEVAQEVSPLIRPQQSVISIIAGVRIHSLGLKLNHGRIIRVMPNTAARVGRGISVWTHTTEVPSQVLNFTRIMLQSLGSEVYLSDEKLLDVATAVSASGPAYVFSFLEALSDAAVLLGMPPDKARMLALETILGSAHLAHETGEHPAALRNMVTSPGGTTAAALHALEQGNFSSSIIDAVRAAHKRSEELGLGLK